MMWQMEQVYSINYLLGRYIYIDYAGIEKKGKNNSYNFSYMEIYLNRLTENHFLNHDQQIRHPHQLNI